MDVIGFGSLDQNIQRSGSEFEYLAELKKILHLLHLKLEALDTRIIWYPLPSYVSTSTPNYIQLGSTTLHGFAPRVSFHVRAVSHIQSINRD